jgi:hypothetical protein
MRRGCVVAVIALLCSAGLGTDRAAEPPKKVTLTLGKVLTERDENSVCFQCEATFDNAFGKVLVVHTSFFSAFDGLSVVLFDDKGKKLIQQPYIYHQSPQAAPGAAYQLPVGKTTKTLVFPVDLPNGVKPLRVGLIGTLPGSEYESVLLMTDLVEVTVK